VCVCIQGFTNHNGVCSRCPPGALWSSASSRCVFVCGQNSAFSVTANACVCNTGFGLLDNICSQCPAGHFIRDGFCVTCPINSVYNVASRACECRSSSFFTDINGVCVPKCETNEFYDQTSQRCRCIQGLGRVSGACQICPAGSRPTNDG